MATSNTDLLRVSFIGSVDNGKSTLIGRLLLDSHLLKQDQLEQIKSGENDYNLAQVTDGLREERSQGITIDVAYRFFQTKKRRFIICDCPGHEQFTANMCSGTSEASSSLVLIDSTTPLTTQTKRHLFISALMGARSLVLCINKLDLAHDPESLYNQKVLEVQSFLNSISTKELELHFIPISALKGFNIVHKNSFTWFQGPTLMELLETLPATGTQKKNDSFRATLQDVYAEEVEGRILRHYRLKIESGTLKTGDLVTFYPSNQTVEIKKLSTFDDPNLLVGHVGQCLNAHFTQDIAPSRGELLTAANERLELTTSIKLTLFWFSKKEIQVSDRFILKGKSAEVLVEVEGIKEDNTSEALDLKTIKEVLLNSASEMLVEVGSQFVLICPQTHQTVGAAICRT